MFANLLNLKNVAIISGLLLTAFAVQSYRLKLKTNKVERLQIELNNNIAMLETAITANETNHTTITELEQANQQCAQQREANEQHAAAEHTRHMGALTDIEKKYHELRKTKVVSKCAGVAVSGSVIELLRTRDSQRD